jgi:hypothetical protein
LEKQLRPLALHFDVKRRRGKTLRMAVKTTAGEDLLLGPGGRLEMVRPEITRTDTPEGKNIRLVAPSLSMAREALEGLKRTHPNIDIEAELAKAEVRHTYAEGTIPLTIEFAGELSGRSLVKTALALAHSAGISTLQCGDALNYLRNPRGEPCYGFYYVDDLVVNRPLGVPLHCVGIKAMPDSGLVLGYVEYFGIHRAVVCLGRDYTGEAVQRVYALDPRSGKDLEVSVRLDFDEADITAIYNYERDDHAARQAAFGEVFGPALRAHQEEEGKRVVQDALKYAWENSGAEPQGPRTAIDFANICRLFADRATPWFQHVTGLPEDLARLQALGYIDGVLRSTLAE